MNARDKLEISRPSQHPDAGVGRHGRVKGLWDRIWGDWRLGLRWSPTPSRSPSIYGPASMR